MTRHRVYFITPVFLLSLLALVFAIAPTLVQASSGSFIGKFNVISKIVSTVPKNGDVNPYGVAVVRNSIGKLTQGNILVSNFNNSANLQAASAASSLRSTRAHFLERVLEVLG